MEERGGDGEGGEFLKVGEGFGFGGAMVRGSEEEDGDRGRVDGLEV